MRTNQCTWSPNSSNSPSLAPVSGNCQPLSPQNYFGDISDDLFKAINKIYGQEATITKADDDDESFKINAIVGSPGSKYTTDSDNALFRCTLSSNTENNCVLEKMIYSKDDNTIKPISDFKFDKYYKNLYNVYYQDLNNIYYVDETQTPWQIISPASPAPVPFDVLNTASPDSVKQISLYHDHYYSKVLKINCFNNGLLASVDSNCCSVGDQLCLNQHYIIYDSIEDVDSSDNMITEILEDLPVKLFVDNTNNIIITRTINGELHWYNWVINNFIFPK